MEKIAEALVYSVAFFASVEEEVCESRAAIKALESIAYSLTNATDAEKDALAKAAKAELAAEKRAARPREAWVETYENWMENIFGDEEWAGNERVV